MLEIEHQGIHRGGEIEEKEKRCGTGGNFRNESFL